MARHVREVVAPRLVAELAGQFQGAYRIELDTEAEKMWVRYESALPPSLSYLQRSVLVVHVVERDALGRAVCGLWRKYAEEMS